MQTDIADSRVLAQSAADSKHCLLVFDLFTSTIYTYPMKKDASEKKVRTILWWYLEKKKI